MQVDLYNGCKKSGCCCCVVVSAFIEKILAFVAASDLVCSFDVILLFTRAY